jgi:hypothetical protein
MAFLSTIMAAAVLFVLASTGIAASAPTAGPNPGDFVARVDNPWFPLLPGTTFVYRGVKDGKTARDVVTVTHATRTIQGVRSTAVADRLYLAGLLEERTTDWYAQDRRGNVWYFGEATAELDRAGHVTSTEGSWLAGRNGAKAGIYMTARPTVGQSRLQEYYKGHAEDHFAVVSLRARISVPYTTSNRALLTKEWTPLERGVIDHKLYIRGIGNVEEETIKGGDEHLRLVSVKRPS